MFAMAFNIINLILVILVASPAVSATVYIVGDVAGWTTIGNVDYRQWAATKTFRVGDTIRFQYNPRFHNVMQVTHSHYRSCNATRPIATHTSGNDSIAIASFGHHFYLCGVPGHCQSGQKVDINIVKRAPIVSPPSNIPPAVARAPSATAASTRPVLSLQRLVGLILVITFL